MSFYQKILLPIASRFDAETTHDLTLRALAIAQDKGAGRALLRLVAGHVPERSVEAFGLRFLNELGVAAGFDKNAEAINGLGYLGFGHVEVGTLTPRAQIGNPRPRIFRLREDRGIINRMGFPNQGAGYAATMMQKSHSNRGSMILGVSLGKQKETDLELAAQDYLAVMKQVYAYADYLVINVSSPNTPGLRELQGRTYLGQLLSAVAAGNESLAAEHQIPERAMLIKIAPDLPWQEIDAILEAAEAHSMSGIVACNTTLARVDLKSKNQHEAGGLSGLPLRARSTQIIGYISRQFGGRMPVIGAGGVMTADDVKEKLDAGACLVQMYTGLVYKGPGVAGQILRQM